MLELSPALNQATFPLQSGLSFGGDTLNTAVYLARLGIGTSYISALGQDPYSERMLGAWKAEGLNCEHVYQCDHDLPGLYVIHTDKQGERSFHYWRQHSAARALFQNWSQLYELLQRSRLTDYFYLSGITLALCSQQVLQSLFSYLAQYRQQGGGSGVRQ